MQCPECKSEKIVKNGRRKEKQNYLCRNCNRQFINNYDQRGYSREVKEHCLTLAIYGELFEVESVFYTSQMSGKFILVLLMTAIENLRFSHSESCGANIVRCQQNSND